MSRQWPGHRRRGRALHLRPVLALAASARALPGSGLGLSIVAQVVAELDGTVSRRPRPGPRAGPASRSRCPSPTSRSDWHNAVPNSALRFLAESLFDALTKCAARFCMERTNHDPLRTHPPAARPPIRTRSHRLTQSIFVGSGVAVGRSSSATSRASPRRRRTTTHPATTTTARSTPTSHRTTATTRGATDPP